MRSFLAFAVVSLFPVCLLAQAFEGERTQDGVELLTQGPIHEAFAEPITLDAEAAVVIPRQPPEPIAEVPPDARPDAEGVLWIPGYWSWDFEREDFIWVSGVWRIPPPGQAWVPGYWAEADDGYRWVSGFWSDANTERVTYLPPPPRSLEEGPSSPSPGDEYFWAPGCWVWQDTNYAWQAGYWEPIHQDWLWVAPHYCHTPRGFVFIPGYWDYLLSYRGVLFAPAYYTQPIYAQANYYYSPSVVIDVSRLVHCLFVRPNYGHYYYGNYYNTRGYTAWYSHGHSRASYDPFFAYYNWSFGRRDQNWMRGYDDLYRRRARDDFRMPRTYAEQRNWNDRDRDRDDRDGRGSPSVLLARSLSDAAKNNDGGRFRFEQVDRDQRRKFDESARAIRDFQRNRIELEARDRNLTSNDRDRQDRDGRDRDGRDRDGRTGRDNDNRGSSASLLIPQTFRDAASATARNRSNVPSRGRSAAGRDATGSGRSAFDNPAETLDRARRRALGQTGRDDEDRSRPNTGRPGRDGTTTAETGPGFPDRDAQPRDSSARGRGQADAFDDPTSAARQQAIENLRRGRAGQGTTESGGADATRQRAIEEFRRRQSGQTTVDPRGSDATRQRSIEEFRRRQGSSSSVEPDASRSSRSFDSRDSDAARQRAIENFQRGQSGRGATDAGAAEAARQQAIENFRRGQSGRGAADAAGADAARQRAIETFRRNQSGGGATDAGAAEAARQQAIENLRRNQSGRGSSNFRGPSDASSPLRQGNPAQSFRGRDQNFSNPDPGRGGFNRSRSAIERGNPALQTNPRSQSFRGTPDAGAAQRLQQLQQSQERSRGGNRSGRNRDDDDD